MTKSFFNRTRWLRYAFCTLSLLLTLAVGSAWGATYVKVTSASDLVSGQVYVIAEISTNTKYLVTGAGSKLANTTSGFTVSNNTITTSTATPLEFTLGTVTSGNNTYYTLKWSSTNYLGYSSSTNFRTDQTTTSDNKERWSITPSSNAYKILNVATSTRYIGRNSANIGPYSTSNSYPNCYLFKKQTSTPSLTADPTSLDWGSVAKGASLSTKTFSISGSNLTSGSLSISASTGWSVSPTSKTVSGTLSETTITVTPPSTATAGTKNGTITISGGGLSSNVTVSCSLTVLETYTVNWYVGGSTSSPGKTETVTSGSTSTPPTVSDGALGGSCSSLKFVGWSETNIGSTAYAGTVASLGLFTTAQTITEAKDYYAVFATASGDGATYTPTAAGSLTQGTYVIAAYDTDNSKYLALTGAVTNNSGGDLVNESTGFTLTNGVTTSVPDGTCEFTLTGNTSDGFTIKNADADGYLGYASNNNRKLCFGSSYSTYTWKASANSVTGYPSNGIKLNKGTSYYIYDNGSGTSHVRGYTSATPSGATAIPIYFLKKTGNVTYSDYITTCCNALGSINGSITLTQSGTSVTVKDWTYTKGSAAAESNIDYYTVNLYASTDSYASVVKTGTCEYDEKSTGVTLTGLTYGVTYKIKISATGNTGYCPISETLVETINSTATQTFQLACDVPTNVTASAQTSEGATLSWDDVATNYEYVVDQSSSDPAGSGTAVNGAHSVTLTGLAASTTYYFHVRTNCGNSVYSNWATASFSTTSAAYFTNNMTLWFQAKSANESAWKDGVAAKAWFRDGNSGGEAICTVWQVTAGTGKMYYAAVIPSSGNYRYMTLQRFQSCSGNYISDNGAVSKVDDGGSNVVESNGVNDGSVSWSSTALHLYLRGDILITNGNWESNIGELTDQGGGVWTYTYSNYTATKTSLDFKIYTNYAFWIGNTNSNSNATLSDLVVGSTYNITATYNVNTHALVMSKTPVNYQVHFDMNDHGSAISSYTTVTPNSTISAPSDPSESGWTFGGWYTDDACTTGNEWDFANDPVTETMTLHAKWTRTPVIKLNDATENITVAFGDKAVDATTGYTLSFTVSGLYLTENIAIGKSGTDQAMFTVSPSTVTQSEGTAASTTINVTYKPSTTGSHSATLTLSSAGAVNRTVTLSGTAKWKVVWNTNGGEYITTLVDNNTKPTFPDPAPTSCESGEGASTTFIGWTKTTWTGKKNQAYIDSLTGNNVVHVANTTMANVTDNTTEYHAVFALASGSGGATYKKVTSGLSDYSGQYLIVFETDNICFDGSRSTGQSNTNLDAAGNYKSVVISTSTNPYSIASTSTIDTYSFTISASQTSGKYYIQSASGYYIGSTNANDDGSNELLISTSTTYDNSISVSSGNATITGTNNILKCFKQSGQSDRFRYFKTTAGNVNPIQLYKYDPGVTYSNYLTTCCENKVTLNTGSPSNGTVAFSPTGPIATCSSTPSDRQTTVTVTPNAGYELTGWTKAVSGIVLPDSTSAISTSSGNTAAQSNTYTFAQDANGSMTVTATFSQIMVTSLKLKATQTGESDKIGNDLTMTCYPKEGQTGGNDPLGHSLNVKFHEVLPANALDKEYDWSVRVKATGAADWTNVGFTGNVLNTNNIINSYNKSTGNLQIKATTGTAEIKITAHDGSGVTAKVTITIANVSVSSISVDPTTMDVYAGQKKPVTITFSPTNATDKAYTTGSYTYVTMRSSGSNPFYIEGNATNVVRNETVTVTSHDGSKTATIDVTVNPLPKATFIDIVHGKTDFLVEGESVLVDGTLTATVVNEGLDVDTEWHTPTHVDVADPGDGHNTCERQHLHLVGWILKDWADLHPDATHSEIVTAGATNFYVPNAALDLSSASVNGKTYYAVWAKVVTP